VAVDVVQAPNDKQQLTAMLEQVEQRVGSPAVTSADSGYYGEPVIEALERAGSDLLVPPDRQVHGDSGLPGTLPERASTTDWMRYKMRTTIAAALYRMRKAIVEPVFGQIKSVRGLRRFLLRGLGNVRDEFRLMAFTHNRLKLASTARRASPEQVTTGLSATRKAVQATARCAVRDAVSGSAAQPLTAWGARGERPRSPRT
jgi:Transposase DDE domain